MTHHDAPEVHVPALIACTVDPSALVREHGTAYARDLVANVAGSLEARVAVVRRALGAGDRRLAAFSARSLKSVAEVVGAPRLAQVAAHVEHTGLLVDLHVLEAVAAGACEAMDAWLVETADVLRPYQPSYC